MAAFQQRVYLLRREGFHKIGISWNPPYRATRLDAVVIHEIVCDDAAWAERALHERYAPDRVFGEWFDLSPEQVDELQSIVTMDRPRPNQAGAGVPLGSRVRELRERRGLTRKELAGRAGMPPSRLASIEVGKSDPRLSDLNLLAEALCVSIAELVG